MFAFTDTGTRKRRNRSEEEKGRRGERTCDAHCMLTFLGYTWTEIAEDMGDTRRVSKVG